MRPRENWSSALLLLLLVASGCHASVRHLRQNAPGLVDLATPPAKIETPGVESPTDPGENMLVVSAGMTLGGSARWQSPDDNGPTGHVMGGAELSFAWGEQRVSHMGDNFFIYPWRSWGANLDLQWLDDETRLGPLALEAVYQEFPMAVAAGPAWDPRLGRFGAQVTLSWVGLYLRTTYLNERGLDLELGYAFKLPVIWTWSR